ncbi:hypothetical protein GCM10011414_07260 [Croceivirga lutea]|uniref:hypothetical protein n=1 Tax=Croceivirga lutea TaxID=1775167 RepID=UPI00163AA122|nr:hypothetical protein [Croceivirga lutea]GGG40302.1 hypothetical protein GCM10011414_07260 [Croceivirga lutea]
MRKLVVLVALLGITTTTFAQTDEQCTDLKSRIPKNLVELSAFTTLTVDLENDCTFQPIHYQVRTEQPTTEIIARFTGEKVGDDFAIEKVELKHFEITENARTVIIDSAYFKNSEINDRMKVIVVLLRNLDDKKWDDAEARKARLEQEIVDFALIPDAPELISSEMIIDIHINNEEELYPEPEVLRSGGEEVLGRPFGSHCKTKVVY